MTMKLDIKRFGGLSKLDICCSSRKPSGYIGIDIEQFPGVDVVHDLNMGIPFDDNSVEEVRAFDAIEHLRDGIFTMKEIWRVLKDQGIVDILVPSTDGRGAWQDLTHVSFWNVNSFGYWVNNQSWMDYYRGPCLFNYEKWMTTEISTDGVCHVIFRARAVKSKEWLDEYNARNKL